MAGGNLNEPTTSAQILFTRERFEREVVLGDRPPYYLDTERHEKETKRRWKIFELPIMLDIVQCLGKMTNGVLVIELREEVCGCI